MANNRLLLVYRPTGRAMVIGKRMGTGWYSRGDILKRLDAFFDEAETEWEEGMNHDDFELVIEHAEHAPALSDEWVYDGDDPLHIKREYTDKEG